MTGLRASVPLVLLSGCCGEAGAAWAEAAPIVAFFFVMGVVIWRAF